MTGPQFCQNKCWSKRSWKISTVSCATVLAKVLAKKDRDMVRKKAWCECEMFGSYVGLNGDDKALSTRSLHVFCSNNFAWLMLLPVSS
jgi:hypothetical protein